MSIPRIYLPKKLSINTEMLLHKEASHHLLHVLRLKPGAVLKIFNGQGGEYKAIFQEQSQVLAKILIEEYLTPNTESPLTIHLAQAIARAEKTDYIIQKATELGVASILPLFTEHGNVMLAPDRLNKRTNHWQQVAIGASEQSGRENVPQILPAQTLPIWLKAQPTHLAFILDPEAKISLTEQHKKMSAPAKEITLLVGPEGGFSSKEIEQAKQAGFIAAHLGPRILRTETAALVAISILQASWGDLADLE